MNVELKNLTVENATVNISYSEIGSIIARSMDMIEGYEYHLTFGTNKTPILRVYCKEHKEFMTTEDTVEIQKVLAYLNMKLLDADL